MVDVTRLEALGGLVDEADEAAGPTPEQAQQQAEEVAAAAIEDQAAKEWGVIAFTIGNALAMLAPELRQVYTEDACLNWGRSVVPVADKYGWGGPSKAPELALVLSTVALVAPTVIVIRHRIKNPEGNKPDSLLGKLAAWWREKRAKKAAEVVKEATDKAAKEGAGVMNGG